MPSCSSSSNITGTSTVLNPTGSQSRIALTLLGTGDGYTVDSNIFAGAVIRYVPSVNYYTLSQANSNVAAEVVGIVESKDPVTDDIRVIMRGLINYPSGSTLHAIPDASGDVSGGSGGNDIYFLSAATAGGVQNLEPDDTAEIAKPVMQAVATDEGYNFQVLNYIGYSVGSEVSAFNGSALPLGSSLLVPEDTVLPDGWVDAGKENELEVAKYPDYYSYATTTNGYVEKVTLDSGTSVSSSLIRKGASQKSGATVISTGRILRVDTTNNQVFVKKSSTSTEFPSSNNTNLLLNNISYTVTAAEIYSIFTPRITTNQSFSVYKDGVLSTDGYKVIYKVKDVGGVTVPNRVLIKELSVTDKLSAANTTDSYTDVAAEITSLKSRVTDLESRVTGIS